MPAGTMALVAGPLVSGPLIGMATSAARRSSALVVQRKSLISSRILICRAEGEDQQPSTSQQEKKTPAPQVDEDPIWVRREKERELMAKEGPGDLPFGVYLLASAMVTIAAVGSVFEYTAKNPIFDIIEADSPLYAPILGLFAITGLPTAAYLFYKSVSVANKEAERMDKIDGYKK